jgi:hypothetical protein
VDNCSILLRLSAADPEWNRQIAAQKPTTARCHQKDKQETEAMPPSALLVFVLLPDGFDRCHRWTVGFARSAHGCLSQSS